MDDRAEAIAYVQQAVRHGERGGWRSWEVPLDTLRALIAEPDERMVERVERAIRNAVQRADATDPSTWGYKPAAKAALAVIQGSDRPMEDDNG